MGANTILSFRKTNGKTYGWMEEGMDGHTLFCKTLPVEAGGPIKIPHRIWFNHKLLLVLQTKLCVSGPSLKITSLATSYVRLGFKCISASIVTTS